MHQCEVRPATAADMPDVMAMIQELATFENMPDGLKITADVLIRDGFGSNPLFRCFVAEKSRSDDSVASPTESEIAELTVDPEAKRSPDCGVRSGEVVTPDLDASRLVGYAMYFVIFSSWEGKSMWLEDLYVRPQYRKMGIGGKLFKAVAKTARAENCYRLDLHVLEWNPARKIYESFGAIDLTADQGWLFYRLTESSLKKLCERELDGTRLAGAALTDQH